MVDPFGRTFALKPQLRYASPVQLFNGNGAKVRGTHATRHRAEPHRRQPDTKAAREGAAFIVRKPPPVRSLTGQRPSGSYVLRL